MFREISGYRSVFSFFLYSELVLERTIWPNNYKKPEEVTKKNTFPSQEVLGNKVDCLNVGGWIK